jgi:putative transposase
LRTVSFVRSTIFAVEARGMPSFRRAFLPGGTFFFTVVTECRAPILHLPSARAALGWAIRRCRDRWPFRVDAIVLLPDHLHAIWSLPGGDTAYPRRWAWIKGEFTRSWLADGGAEQATTISRLRGRRRGVWQRRYWEHLVRDEAEMERLGDYIHYNPVKHGLVACPSDWPYSSFGRWVRLGTYPPDWGCSSRGPLHFDDIVTSAIE